jgi:hypothetical protein
LINFSHATFLPEVILKSNTIPNLATPPLAPNPIQAILRRTPRRRFLSAFLLLAISPLALARQTPTPLPAPPTPPPATQPASPEAIARVTAAKTIFLSNAGANDYFNAEIPNGPNAAYNELYAALQQWGYFQLVDSPAHADLIFQIRGTELAPKLVDAITGHTIAQQHTPNLELTILDPKANPAPLDTITTLAGRANNIPKGTIAFAKSIEWLTYQISTRVSAPRSNPGGLRSRDTLRPSFESLIQSTAPIPPQVLNAKTIYIQNENPQSNPDSDRYAKAFTTALTTWNYYHVTDTPQSADLILHYHDDPANGTAVTLEDPATHTLLWTITDPHWGFYHQVGNRRVAALNQNLISLLKLLNQIPLTPSETAALH